ncbi:hypothetical protein E3P77_00729 [Wallemia ichthyophaga]|uniref:F-box domain-containing protein n=2 Tax=Wallemia ichthyophaga TaxID=245174 RepID=R9AGD3_WALI9|nr:uncharacterized protein J056_004553 [Wallemia ichthyophaga EXF-994]TIA68809.1 hypothetical protein E3P91_03918 [Wallemia ichthyophaga]EOR01232.1 hypothetical protein J056_004553 [Wallemia ichthyophaga EXF-994]TIA83290.1 hypothetical protein E3P98_00925 [Wallemia ichthyophaga]TIB28933.1 hypothetical protein E3P84_03892 [Wallemia ichthyophaga]TIB38625.1 hypothetical protein E3P83_03904 [Wallemia ichthyophaga]
MHFLNLPVEVIEEVYKHASTKSYIALTQTNHSMYAIGHATYMLNWILSRRVSVEYGDEDDTFPWSLFREGLKQTSLCPRCALKRTRRIMGASGQSLSEGCQRIHFTQAHAHMHIHTQTQTNTQNDDATETDIPSQLSSRRGSADSAFSSLSSGAFSETDEGGDDSAALTLNTLNTLSMIEQDQTDKFNCLAHSVSPAAASMLAWLM